MEQASLEKSTGDVPANRVRLGVSVASEAGVLNDRYEVGDVIGRGGMGEVRRAFDRRLQRDVAIKFLRPDLAAQPAVA